MNVGERLRAVRKQLGYTQRHAAALAGMHPQHLCDLERGRIAIPSLETLSRLAAAYGMGVDELIGSGRSYAADELPEGLRELLSDPEWTEAITPAWVETLVRIEHAGRRLRTKRQFLEAYLALSRILQ